jgi:murein DD-endopeptidase MepM/ murein hydrolase activator NlpD
MNLKRLLRAKLDQFHLGLVVSAKSSSILAIAFGVAVGSRGIAEAAAHVDALTGIHRIPASLVMPPAPRMGPTVHTIRWEGLDLDGDGQPDVANPTGHAPRDVDAYGEGRFHAARDGGTRQHQGVDYVASAGQAVVAPISGFVSRIGYAYPGDETLRFVEIENPALHLSARAFYVDPTVEIGQTVAVGNPIGTAQTLQRKYPEGITDHIHLEIADGRGRKLDAEQLIFAHVDEVRMAAE